MWAHTFPMIAFAMSGLLAALGSWLAIKWLLPSLKNRALAVPNDRSSHRVVTPQGAGLGWVAATLLVSGLLLLGTGAFAKEWLFLAAALLGLSFLGFADDIKPLGWRPKLAAQCLLAAVALLALPAIPASMGVQVVALAAITLLFVALINITNFVDGIDEMTVAHGAPALAVSIVLAGLGVLTLSQGLIAAAGLGALAGFWWWNRHPAHIFFGDAGSLPFGLLLGWSAGLIILAGYPVAGLLSIAYPVTDAGLTLAKRWRAGARLTQPHRDHAFQCAVDRGIPVRTVAGTVAFTSSTTAALAVFAVVQGNSVVALACLLLGSVVVLTPILLWLRLPARPQAPRKPERA